METTDNYYFDEVEEYDYAASALQCLIGKRFNKLEVSERENYLRVTTTEGNTHVFYARGDCCSESWFSEILGVHKLFEGNVLEARAVSLEEINFRERQSRQQRDLVYGFRILTEAGTVQLVFRNSSNGYYGGNIELYNADDKYRKKDISKLKWRNIASDEYDWEA